jgi:hypothetical protein
MYAVAGFFGDATEAIPLGTPGTAPGTTGQLRAELPVPSESTLLNGYLWSFVTYVTATSKAEAKSTYESLYPNLDRFIYTGVVFPDDGPPAPPENLSVTDTTGRVELEWTPPAESDLTDLFVYRSKTPIDSSAGPGSLTPYAEVSALDTTFVDTSAAVDSTYYYRVTAGDLLGYESGFSPEAEATVNEPDSLTLAGTVRYYGTSAGVGNVALRLGGNAADTSRTTSDGAFSFDLFARKNYTLSPARPDDAAPARGVTTADLALIRRDVLGTDSLGRYPRLAADADGSSGVSTVDIPLLRRVIQGDATSVPGGLWRFVPADTDSAKSAFNRRSARRYRDLRADRTGQNFVAIKRGDLDTSWVRTTNKRPAAVSKRSGGRPVVVGLPEREVALQADTVTVPIRARAFEGVGGVQFTLEWDPKVLRLLGTTEYRLPGLSAENMGRTEGETRGLATVVWNEPKGQGHSVAPGDSLFALRYRVRTKGESDLTVTSSVTPRYAHDGETLDARRLRGETGTITVKAIPDKFALRANYPNPAHHRTTIEYALPEQAPVTLRLYDVLGRRVATVVNETKEAGRHTVQVQATELSSGVYFYRLRAGDFTKTRRMVIVR